ncbi:MAG: hypothetical protein MR038_05900 [Oscillospiraceae bacterium]|nr:hypothetical protein [Oscillospiraceae bacterium]
MKRTMNEYKASMNKIVPSGSFISETEALMKKIRDEQNKTADNSKTDSLPENAQRIDISADSRTIKIKKWTMGLSAAAAVLVCAVTLNVYNKANVDSQMTKDVETEVSETTVFSEAEASPETTAPAEEKDDITTVVEEITETSAETEAPAAEEKITAETEKTPAEKTDTDTGRKDRESDSSAPEAEHSEDAPGINAANTMDEGPSATVYEEESSSDDYVPYGYDHQTEYYEDEYPEEEADDSDYGTPVWVPSFIDEDEVMEEEAAVEEYDDSGEGTVPLVTAIDEQSYDSSPVSRYTLDVSFSTASSDADEVYVPDTISDLDSGEYYISAEAGFDEYDPVSGTFIVSNGAMFDESVTNINSSIIDEITGLTASKSQYHCDSETKMYDYRYKITIYSADESENNAKLFEITFNNGELVINRYDNGTVSSGKYTLTAEEFEELDSFIGSLF